jgi:DNA polymerase III subunit epsilon
VKWFRRTPLAGLRWIAIDCETSGLDAKRDRLLSVGALEVREGRIVPDRAFSAVVRQAQPSAPQNIVIHGIGAEAQLAGRPADAVLAELAVFVGDGVPVAFHAPFDAEVLRRHGFTPRRKWLDLAQLAPALCPREKARPESLDDWLAAFGIAPQGRHDALGDAYASAQMLLVLLARARAQGAASLEDLFAASAGARWLR